MAFERNKVTLSTLNNYLEVTAEMQDPARKESGVQFPKGYYPKTDSSFQIFYSEVDDGKSVSIQASKVEISNNLGSNKVIITKEDLQNERVILQGEPITLETLVDYLSKNTGA